MHNLNQNMHDLEEDLHNLREDVHDLKLHNLSKVEVNVD